MRYLAKAAGKEILDQMDPVSGGTVLHLVCELLTDFYLVNTIVERGVEVNAVRNDDKMPLSIVNAKLAKDPNNEVLKDIKELLESKGAKADWRNINS